MYFANSIHKKKHHFSLINPKPSFYWVCNTSPCKATHQISFSLCLNMLGLHMEDAAWPSGSRIVQEKALFDSKMKSWGRGGWFFPLDGSSCSNSSSLQYCCCREGPGSSNRAQSRSRKTKGFPEQQAERNVCLTPLGIISRKKGWSLCPKHELLHSKPPRQTWKLISHCQAGRNTRKAINHVRKTWAACCTWKHLSPLIIHIPENIPTQGSKAALLCKPLNACTSIWRRIKARDINSKKEMHICLDHRIFFLNQVVSF